MLFLFTMRPALIAAAVIPAIVLLVYVYRRDRLEAEPFGLLLLLVVNGMISTVPASFFERIGGFVLGLFTYTDERVYNALLYFLVVGFSEEVCKYLLMKRKTWLNDSFNCQYDGIVYAVFVSLGFALLENVQYVLSYGFETALLRAVTAVPGHCCFGVLMGAWYGLAKRLDNEGWDVKSSWCRRMAVLFPTLLHGAYDYIASDETGSSLPFILFVAVMFFISFLMVKRLSNHDRYID